VHCHDEFVMHQTGNYGNSVRRFQCKIREKIVGNDFNVKIVMIMVLK
jgi:hypothetical protein